MTKAASLGAIAYLLAVFSLKLFAISDSEIIASPYDSVAYAQYGMQASEWPTAPSSASPASTSSTAMP